MYAGLENREYSCRDPSRWPRGTLCPQKLARTSPTSGGCLVGIVRSRTKITEFSFRVFSGLVYWSVHVKLCLRSARDKQQMLHNISIVSIRVRWRQCLKLLQTIWRSDCLLSRINTSRIAVGLGKWPASQISWSSSVWLCHRVTRPLVTGLVPYMESGYSKFFTYMNEVVRACIIKHGSGVR
jgi:hypothetical protein